MIGHVASAGESRGRVVLRITCGAPLNRPSFEAAAQIAKAFGSEIEGLFVEDSQLLDLTGYDFTREIHLNGRRTRNLSTATVEAEFHAAYRSMCRQLAEIAQQFEVRSYATRVRDEPITALARACARAGPWNVIVVGEPMGPHSGGGLGAILEIVRDATGLVVNCSKPRSSKTRGPVVVVVEDPDRLISMMRTGERLAAADGRRDGVVALLAGDDIGYLDWLEGQARLALAHGPIPRFVIAPPARGEPAVIAEAVRQLKASFVIARFGGLAVPQDDLQALNSVLDSPLFLVR